LDWTLYLILVSGLFAYSALRYSKSFVDDAFRFWMIWLHLAFGVVPLLLGAVQLMAGFQFKRPALHCLIGHIYCACIIVNGSAAILLGLNSQLPLFGYALLLLDVVWWLITATAIYHIRRRQILRHRQWMIRSFLVTNAFIIFRLMIPLALLLPVSTVEVKFAIVVTIAWVVPLLIYQWHLKRSNQVVATSA